MSFLGNFFPPERKQPGGEQSVFRTWPRPPHVAEIPAGRQALPALPVGRQAMSAALGPSVMIGLGPMGRAVMEQWLKQTAYYEAESFRRARLLLISRADATPWPASAAPRPYYLSLGGDEAQGEGFLKAFLKAPILRTLNDWMRVNTLDLRDCQVLIIGSVAEPEIQTLGALLQILRSFFGENSVSVLNIVALLSLAPFGKRNSLSSGERYAALREIGRFTFSGIHKAIEIPGMKQNLISSALLDHLFLFDESAFQKNDGLEGALAQALGETLLFLSHPSSRVFWEALKNNPVGEFRERYAQPFINALGVKTFFLPLAEMQNYLSVRLAQAVFFGERAQDYAEQFVSNAPLSSEDQQLAESLARRWLTARGAGYHPVFEWIVAGRSPKPGAFPDLDPAYHDLYAYQASLQLVQFLNEENRQGKLRLAELAFDFHIRWFEALLSAAHQANADNFSYTLHIWKKNAEALRHALRQWQKTFSQEALPDADNPSPHATLQSSWKTPAVSSASQSEQSVNDILSRKLKEAERVLKNIDSGQVLFPLTYHPDAPLLEVKRYYEESVRPELLRAGLPASPAFRATRSRLEWWVRLIPSRDPELMVVCWSGLTQAVQHSQPPYEMCFFYEDKQKLAEAILAISSSQFSNYNELTGGWYLARLKELISRVDGRADEAFLSYDENESVKFGGELRRYYLAAKDQTVSAPFVKKLFPLQSSDNVQEIDGYDPARFSALTTRLCLPLSALNAARRWYEDYGHAPYFHTYVQEKNAAAYEDRYFRLFGVKTLFPPPFVMALSDAQLVTLFCQALIGKLVYLQEMGAGSPPVWQLAPVGDFNALPLEAQTSPDGLFYAFRKFTLEMPGDPNVKLNPHNHFHPNRRAAFLDALLRRARAIRKGENFREFKIEFQNGLLSEWLQKSEPLAAAFSAVLQVELEEPVWEGWYA